MKYRKEVSAGGIVYKNENGKTLWLITQHSKHKGWGFPKGLIGDTQKNEPMEEAALREVQEEGGVSAKIINNKPVITNYKYRFQEYLVDKSVYYFLMEYVSGDPKDHDWEVSDAKFVNEDEVKNTLSFKSDKEAFEKILSLYPRKPK
ncbi:NUDIX domain-containing protein [Candidatus Roizmanbacteria bacterium]|nr:NUDIX domain-containing protein [Candidatus Roizmanbacteria bacterium]